MNGFPNQNGQSQQQIPQFDQNTMNQLQQASNALFSFRKEDIYGNQ